MESISQFEMDENIQYLCDICGYFTKQKSHLVRHKKSRKHLDNIKRRLIEEQNKKTAGRPKKYQSHKEGDKYICDICDKSFNFASGVAKHIKKFHTNNDTQQLINNNTTTNTDNSIQQQQGNFNNGTINTVNNINNGIIGSGSINNTKINIQYLDKYFPDMIPIRDFIHNIKTDYKLTNEEAHNLLASKKVSSKDFYKEFSKLLDKKCHQQIEDLGITPNIRNKLPMISTDTGLRSHNEKTDLGWKRVTTTNNLKDIYNEYERQVFEITQEIIGLTNKEKNMLYNFLRKEHGIYQHFDPEKLEIIHKKELERIRLQEIEEKRRKQALIKSLQEAYLKEGCGMKIIPGNILLAEPDFSIRPPPSIYQ